MLLEVMGVACGYGARPVLENATFSVSRSELLGIVGPNGSGKSTLLRAMSRVLPPKMGQILLQDEDLYKMRLAKVARRLAVVPQESGLDFPFTVQDIVMMGRIPHLKRFQKEGPHDRDIVEQALVLTDTYHLSQRLVTELSGGEKQRVLIARALAQEPQVLFLDEPTSFLDLNYQIEIMELLTRLRQQQGLTVVMVVHDLNLASQYCDKLLVLKDGIIHTAGPPEKVVTEEIIKEVYGCDITVEYRHPGGRPMLFLQPANRQPRGFTKGRVHVVGGGGSSALLFNQLVEGGWQVSAGVINVGDSDWQEASRLRIQVVEAPPFSQISMEAALLNRECMDGADYIVLPLIPFGFGNLPNLEAVLKVASEGGPVIVIDNGEISQRDYTGGLATREYQALLQSGAFIVKDESEALQIMEGGTAYASPR